MTSDMGNLFLVPLSLSPFSLDIKLIMFLLSLLGTSPLFKQLPLDAGMRGVSVGLLLVRSQSLSWPCHQDEALGEISFGSKGSSGLLRSF